MGQIKLIDGVECYYNKHISGGSITIPWENNIKHRLIHKELMLKSVDSNELYSDIVVTQNMIPLWYMAQYINEYNINNLNYVNVMCYPILNTDKYSVNIPNCEVVDFLPLLNDGVVKIELIEETSQVLKYNDEQVLKYNDHDVEKLLLKITHDVHDWCMDVKNNRKVNNFVVKDWFEKHKK